MNEVDLFGKRNKGHLGRQAFGRIARIVSNAAIAYERNAVITVVLGGDAFRIRG